MLHLTCENFETRIIKDPRPAVVLFYARWCGKCAMTRPMVEDAAERHQRRVRFFEVEIDESDMFSFEGNGLMATSKGFDYERLIDAFNAYGQALCAYEDACRYANQRIVKGQEIGRLQLIQNHIMEMTMRIEAMRNMLLHYAWNKDNGMLTRAEASIAKQFCSESANIVVDHALQILGGIGFCGSRVSRIYRDLRITRISGGTGEIQTVIAARQVLKKYR